MHCCLFYTVKIDSKVTGVTVKNADELLLRLMGRGESKEEDGV